MITTIKISNEAKTKLESLKVHRRQSYEEVILSLLQTKLGEKPQESQNDAGKAPTLSNTTAIIVPVLEKYGIRHAAIFGSVARRDSNEKSDVDILIERPENAVLVLPLITELKEALHRDVDLVTYESLDSHIKEQVLKESVRVI